MLPYLDDDVEQLQGGSHYNYVFKYNATSGVEFNKI